MKVENLDIDSLPDGLSQDVKSKVKRLIVDNETEDIDQDKTTSKVSTDMCNAMNKLYDRGLTQREVADVFDMSRTTIIYHLNDKCKHEYRSKVTYSECGWMRFHANNGAPTSTLAILYDLSEEHTRRHVLGRCTHSHECPTPSPEELRSNGYNNAKDLVTSVCPICEEEFKHKPYFDRTTCSEECKYKYAGRKSAEARATSD